MRKECLLFAKEGRAVWISHLDLMRSLARAFIRAQIPLAYSEGFNPHPYLSVPLPLPVGVSSDCEILSFGVENGADISDILPRLNGALPEGLVAKRILDVPPDSKEIAAVVYRYDLRWPSSSECDAALALLDGRPLLITKKSKKGMQTVDIAPLIAHMDIQRRDGASAQATFVLTAAQSPTSPSILVKAWKTHATAPEFCRIARLRVVSAQGGDWVRA